jgi:hypothetical protein
MENLNESEGHFFKGKYNEPLSDSRSEIYRTRFENWFAID